MSIEEFNARVAPQRSKPKPKLKSTDLARLLELDPWNGVALGRVRAMRDRYELTAKQAQFIDRLSQFDAAGAETGPKETKPLLAPRPTPRPMRIAQQDPKDLFAGPGRRQATNGLGDPDFRLLESIPSDPAAITDADAAELLRLESMCQSESERRLVARKLQPVRVLREREAARADLEWRASMGAWASMLGIFADGPARRFALEALQEAIAGEVPELTEVEAMQRARALVDEAHLATEASAQRAVDDAKTRLAEMATEGAS